MKHCPECQTPNPEDAQYCGNCGHTFDLTIKVKNQKPIHILIIGIILLIIILIITANILSTPTTQTEDTITLTIKEINGYTYNAYPPALYELQTIIILPEIPENPEQYQLQTTYYHNNKTIQTITDQVQLLTTDDYETDYANEYTIGNRLSQDNTIPDKVTVKLLKNSKTINKQTYNINTETFTYIER